MQAGRGVVSHWDGVAVIPGCPIKNPASMRRGVQLLWHRPIKPRPSMTVGVGGINVAKLG